MKYYMVEEHIRIYTNIIFELFCNAVPEMTIAKPFLPHQMDGSDISLKGLP